MTCRRPGVIAREFAIAPSGATIARALFIVAALVAVGGFLYVGRDLTFYLDEWTFIDQRMDLSLDDLMRPHNEHWAFIHVIVYRLLFGLFGLGSYLPYLALLLVLHAIVAAGVFRLLEHHAGPIVALGGSVLFLGLGSGYEDLLWGFQIGFVGSSAAGVWALVLLDTGKTRRALWTAGGLLLVGVATSGMGLVFLPAAAALLVLDPARRSWLIALAPATAAYLLWFATYGRTGIDSHRDPFTVDALRDLPGFIVSGGGGAVGLVSGLGADAGLVIFIVLVGATAWRFLRSEHLEAMAVAALVGLLAELTLTGLVRGQFGVAAATASRYVYVGAIFVLVAGAAWVGREPSPGRPLVRVAVVGALLLPALIGNVDLIFRGRDHFLAKANEARAVVTIALAEPPVPGIDEQAIFALPTISRLRLLVAEHGSPLHDSLLGRGFAAPPSAALDRALIGLVSPGFRVEPAPGPRPDFDPPTVVGTHDSVTEPDGSCLRLAATGPDPYLVIRTVGGGSIWFATDRPGGTQVFLSRLSVPVEDQSIRFDVTRSSPVLVRVPDLGGGRWIDARLDPVDGTTGSTICVVPGSTPVGARSSVVSP